MTIADAAVRARAIDPLRSFCVSAPAGSGKTELLIQRYLGLLARVQRPEQVLAITFTRKAAAEMRERVLQALQDAQNNRPVSSDHERVTRALAQQALAADLRGNWQVARDIARLNIRTIDSFCGGLTRQMPVLSEFGGQATPVDDAAEYYAEAVQQLFALLDSEHAVANDLQALMLHFDNNWERLQSLLVAMLARRDQWRDYVGIHRDPDESEAYLLATVERLVCSELGHLAARLAPYAEPLLDLQHYAAANLNAPALQRFPQARPEDVGAWRTLQNLLQTKEGTWRRRLDKNMGFPAGKGEAQARKTRLNDLLDELRDVDDLEQQLAAVVYLPVIEAGSASWQLLVHLSRLLPVLAAQLLLVFQRHGTVDHCQVALSALQALGEDDAPTELALRLDYQIEHILVDEFQDTSINQYELLRCLTRGWGTHNNEHPDAPRTLLVVGDGMQSIYGFRGANVGLFLKAREEGFNGVQLEHLLLRCNFRSDEGVVDWVNETFAWAFPAREDINRGQVSYQPASAVRPARIQPAVSLHAFEGDTAREQEVAFICAAIADFSARDSGGTLAVLGRTRSHLQPLVAALRTQGLAYSAQDLDSLAASPLVADLMTLCRALANPADRLAWLALLRAPWCGLTLADLLPVGRWGEPARHTPLWPQLLNPELQAQLSADGQQRLQALLPILQRAQEQRDRLGLRAWIEQAWLALHGPQTALDSAALVDAEHFFQLLEQADWEGRGLDVDWLATRLEKDFMAVGSADCRVQLMTLHKAKGLEFEQVIIPRLGAAPRADDRELLLWDEYRDADGERAFLLAANDHSENGAPTLYNTLRQRRKNKSLLEGTRLLYVGVTRAISRLMLTTTLARDKKTGEFRQPAARSLLSPVWATFSTQMTVHEVTPVSATAAPVPAPALQRLAMSALAPNSTVPAASAASAADPVETVHSVAANTGSAAGTGTTASVAAAANVPEQPNNFRERAVGTVVHLALEVLSQRANLPEAADIGPVERDFWRVALQTEGLFGAALEQAMAAVEHSVICTLTDRQSGRWLLSAEHHEAHSEWAIAAIDDRGRVQELVIDRTFVDANTGLRWLIDYKTSQPLAEESQASFLKRESATYRPQLTRYRDALRQLDSRPVRCALYFTALGYLQHLPDLDSG